MQLFKIQIYHSSVTVYSFTLHGYCFKYCSQTIAEEAIINPQEESNLNIASKNTHRLLSRLTFYKNCSPMFRIILKYWLYHDILAGITLLSCWIEILPPYYLS